MRTTIEKCKKENNTILKDFPNAYCGTASIWLYDSLKYNGLHEIEFHMKDPFLEDRQGNHVWIYTGGYNIDITADQYNEDGFNFNPVIVTNKIALYNNFDIHDIPSRESMIQLELISRLFMSNITEEWKCVYKYLGINFICK